MFVSFAAGGLLHNAPKHDEERDTPEKIKKALHECVVERKPGGHLKAVNSLSEVLSLFVGMHLVVE